MPWFSLFMSLGLIFGAMAGAMAFIIMYREYVHHFKTARQARSHALKGALVAFLFFVGMTLASGYVISHVIVPNP